MAPEQTAPTTTAQGAPDTNMTPVSSDPTTTIQTPQAAQQPAMANPAYVESQGRPQAAPPAPTQTPSAPTLTNTPANKQSSLHAKLFDNILNTRSGGPIVVN